jgi:hypothetical protein
VVPPRKVLGHGRGGPLNTRGWVLQERLLSPRLLQCTYTEFIWECSCLEASETFPNGIHSKKSLDKSWFSAAGNDPAAWYEVWNKRYSTMDFTIGSDKLIAFSGLAQKMFCLNESSDKDYLAGIWRPRLMRELLWITRLGEGKSTRDEPYRAPSWSWAKTNGRVTFRYDTEVSKDAQCYVEVVEVKMAPLQDLFGQITAGCIRLQGPLCLLLIGGRSCNLGSHEISKETLLRQFVATRNRPTSNMVIYDEAGSRPKSAHPYQRRSHQFPIFCNFCVS